jgi:hypothetical protein
MPHTITGIFLKKFVFLASQKSGMLQSTPLQESRPRDLGVTAEEWQIGLPKVDGFHYMFNTY